MANNGTTVGSMIVVGNVVASLSHGDSSSSSSGASVRSGRSNSGIFGPEPDMSSGIPSMTARAAEPEDAALRRVIPNIHGFPVSVPAPGVEANGGPFIRR